MLKLSLITGGCLLIASAGAHAICGDVTNTSSSRTTTLFLNYSGCAENTGTITISTFSDSGIYSDAGYSTVTNSGTITTTEPSSHGIFAFGGWDTITNSGTITTTGSNSYAIRSSGTAVTNSGTITTSGQYGYGIYSDGASTTNTNAGTITTSGQSAYGIYSLGANTTINNAGTIRATGANSAAIYVGSTASNNTVNLLKGSVIVGDIFAHSSATGAKLNINLGAGASYAYTVTGPWTVTDLDNRPMVRGSAFAAGIGAQETASQMLYQRTASVTSALDRRLRSYAADEVDNQAYWLDVYYSDVSRNSGGNYSTRNAFSNYNYGMTAGFKLPVEVTPMELVVNVEQSNLNIDSGNQKIDSTGIMAGVLAPNVTEILGAKLSAKALVGFTNNDGDRKVMTNSLLYNGSRQIKSDYNSTYAVLGAALTKLHPITDRLTADAIVGLDLVTEHINAYAETDYFAWQGRTLNQLQSRIQAGLDYRFNENKASVFARVGVERRDLISGDTQNYAINDAGIITHVSFKSNNSNDTYVTAQLGVKAQLEKRIQLFGIINGLHSSDTVSSIQGNIGLRADF